MTIDTTEIKISDLEDVRQVLAACYNYFLGRDIQEAQVEFRAQRPSPLTGEIERVKERFDGYFGDFLLAEHEASLEEDEAEVEDDAAEAEEGSDEPTEVLSGAPLGDFKAPKQAGRRVVPVESAGE